MHCNCRSQLSAPKPAEFTCVSPCSPAGRGGCVARVHPGTAAGAVRHCTGCVPGRGLVGFGGAAGGGAGYTLVAHARRTCSATLSYNSPLCGVQKCKMASQGTLQGRRIRSCFYKERSCCVAPLKLGSERLDLLVSLSLPLPPMWRRQAACMCTRPIRGSPKPSGQFPNVYTIFRILADCLRRPDAELLPSRSPCRASLRRTF